MAVELDGKNRTVCKHEMNLQSIKESIIIAISEPSIDLSKLSVITMTILTYELTFITIAELTFEQIL